MPLFVSLDLASSKHLDKLVSYVLGKLDDTDPVVSSAIWDAGLCIVHGYPVITSFFSFDTYHIMFM